jgi:hypothetical protein
MVMASGGPKDHQKKCARSQYAGVRDVSEQPHIGDIPANEVPISLVEEHPDVLHAFYHVFLGS